jgi:3-hydroxyacyl-CoA dehydrogenase
LLMSDIQTVAVLGAGLMGSGIAAQVANAGHKVLLLDIVPEGAEDRDVLAKGAIARLGKTKPAPLMHRSFAKRITPGNLEDHLEKLAEVDWICEAVLEDLTVKHKVYAAVDKHRKPGSIVTSNTSTIPLNLLTDGMSDTFRQDFAVTHFFNPPRYMRLLELVGGPETRPDALDVLRRFCDIALGKTVVDCNDTPGFIANRIGIYWSTVATQEALRLGLTVEEADSIVGAPMGIPKTGIFGLADLTGIDLAPHINASMLATLPKQDAFVQEFDADGPLSTLVGEMIAKGMTGRKGGGGFYRRRTVDGQRIDEALDLTSGEYRPKQKARLASARAGRKGLRALVSHEDKGGQYAWAVLSKTLSYAASLVPEISSSIEDIDAAMKTGYAWKSGPFEQIDQLGPAWFAEKLIADSMTVPDVVAKAGDGAFYREQDGKAEYLSASGEYMAHTVAADSWRLADMKRGAKRLKGNASASLWDVGDGVACLELHSKMNAIDPDIAGLMQAAAKIDRDGFKALIIGSDADNFSVGANVGIVLFAANAAMWPVIEQSIAQLQSAMTGLRDSNFPVVAAVAGMALGGGCELAMHANAVQAHGESYMGLVEGGVGLIPAGGGTKELVTRAWLNKKRPQGPMPPVMQAFESISTAKVGTSAAECRDLLYLRPDDGISMNRDRLLADAKARALAMVDDYVKPEPVTISLPGPGGRVALEMAIDGFVQQGAATEYDSVVGGDLANVLTGGDTDMTGEISEKQLLDMERTAFLTLVRNEKTLDRIQHILDTGRPLRN